MSSADEILAAIVAELQRQDNESKAFDDLYVDVKSFGTSRTVVDGIVDLDALSAAIGAVMPLRPTDA